MKQPENDGQSLREERLAEFADLIQDRIADDIPEIAENGSLPVDLTPQELAELNEIRATIGMVEQARKSLEQLRSAGQLPRRQLTFDSTRVDHTAGTIHDAKPIGHDFDQDHSAPMTVGRFVIQSVLGQGGFAKVFLAFDPRLERQVALKIPLPNAISDEAARRRFQREAKAAAILSHPAIVPIYESGVAGLTSYIAFGYCPGSTLGEWLATQPTISPALAASIVAKIADAVAHAHQRGIVHRDLKPSNILLTESYDDAMAKSSGNQSSEEMFSSRIRISDFGLAQLQSADAESLTLSGAVVGTPGFMSPEQARSEPTVGPTSDIFSIGVVFYVLLTGLRPFTRNTPLSTLRAIEFEEPTRPRDIRPEVPKDLESICLKCLRKIPEQRYQSAYELFADLDRYHRGQPVTARPASWTERLALWRRRNPRLAGTAAIATLFLLMGIGGTTWQWRKAVASSKQSQVQQGRAIQIADLLSATFRSPDPSMAGKDVRAADLLQQAEWSIGESLADQPQDRWSLLYQIGKSYIGLGMSAESARVFRRILIEKDNAAVPVDVETIHVTLALAQAMNAQGKFPEAMELSKEAHRLALDCLGADHPDTKWIATDQASIYQSLGDHAAAEQILQQAIAYFRDEESLDVPDHFLPHLESRLGGCVLRSGRPQEAVAILAVATPKLTEILGLKHPDTLTSRDAYATALWQVGQKHDSLEIRTRILNDAEEVFGQRHPQTLRALNNLAATYNRLGKSDQSVEHYVDCLARTKSTYGENNLFTFKCLKNAASAYRRSGNQEQAMLHYQQAYEGFRGSLGATHQVTQSCRFEAELSRLRVGLNDGPASARIQAAEHFQDYMKTIESPSPTQQLVALRTYGRLLYRLLDLGAIDEAIPFAETYLEVAQHASSAKDIFLSRFFGSAVLIQDHQAHRAGALFMAAVTDVPSSVKFGDAEKEQLLSLLGPLENRLAASDSSKSGEMFELAERLRIVIGP